MSSIVLHLYTTFTGFTTVTNPLKKCGLTSTRPRNTQVSKQAPTTATAWSITWQNRHRAFPGASMSFCPRQRRRPKHTHCGQSLKRIPEPCLRNTTVFSTHADLQQDHLAHLQLRVRAWSLTQSCQKAVSLCSFCQCSLHPLIVLIGHPKPHGSHPPLTCAHKRPTCPLPSHRDRSRRCC